MSILIKGIQMPTSCGKCFVGNREICVNGCPLVPIPPHGDLIDRDALMLRINIHGTNKFGMLDEDIRQFVNAAPTIIPADDKDINVPNKEEGE